MRSARRRPRRRVEMNFLLSFTSMTDMFTNVLLFLLFFVNPATVEDVNFALPQSTASAVPSAGPRLRIAKDEIAVDSAPVMRLAQGQWRAGEGSADDRGPLVEALGRAREKISPPQDAPTVVVECDEGIPWVVLGAVLQSAQDAGFAQYRLIVLGEG